MILAVSSLLEARLLLFDVMHLTFEIPESFKYQELLPVPLHKSYESCLSQQLEAGQYVMLQWKGEWPGWQTPNCKSATAQLRAAGIPSHSPPHPRRIWTQSLEVQRVAESSESQCAEERRLTVHIRASPQLDWCSALCRHLLAEALGGEPRSPRGSPRPEPFKAPHAAAGGTDLAASQDAKRHSAAALQGRNDATRSEAKEPAPGTEVCFERLQLPNGKVCCKVPRSVNIPYGRRVYVPKYVCVHAHISSRVRCGCCPMLDLVVE